MTRKPPQLDKGVRDRLFSRVEALRKADRPSPLEHQPAISSQTKKYTDFTKLPGYSELRIHRSLADAMSIESPFFRVHDGLAGSRTEIKGKTCVNWSSYDYLGLNGHPEVIDAAKTAIDRYGISSSASRLVAGEREVHAALEQAIAAHYQVDDCAVFVSGYATNVGVIGHLLGPKDLIVYDAAIHNSVLTGGVLSGAKRRTFRHNDLDNLDEVLSSARAGVERVLIVVEGLYSMDGDCPDLPGLIAIKNKYDAWLMVDEAHALGVLGARGYGLAEHFSVHPSEVDIWMGTLSKTLAGCGGYIAGPTALIEYLKCTSGVFVYSVGMPPAIAASTRTALAIMHREPERVAALQKNARQFHKLAEEHGLDIGTSAGSAVCPVMVADSLPAVVLSQRLLERGINALPIIYPAVPAKASRLRFFITSTHTDDDVRETVEVVAEEVKKVSMKDLKIKFAKLQQ